MSDFFGKLTKFLRREPISKEEPTEEVDETANQISLDEVLRAVGKCAIKNEELAMFNKRMATKFYSLFSVRGLFEDEFPSKFAMLTTLGLEGWFMPMGSPYGGGKKPDGVQRINIENLSEFVADYYKFTMFEAHLFLLFCLSEDEDLRLLIVFILYVKKDEEARSVVSKAFLQNESIRTCLREIISNFRPVPKALLVKDSSTWVIKELGI